MRSRIAAARGPRRGLARSSARRHPVRGGGGGHQVRRRPRFHRDQARRARDGRRGVHEEPLPELRGRLRSRGARQRPGAGADGPEQERERLHPPRRGRHARDGGVALRGARRRPERHRPLVHRRHRRSAPDGQGQGRDPRHGGEAPARGARRRRAGHLDDRPRAQGGERAHRGSRRLRHGQGRRHARAEHGDDARVLLHERRRRRLDPPTRS